MSVIDILKMSMWKLNNEKNIVFLKKFTANYLSQFSITAHIGNWLTQVHIKYRYIPELFWSSFTDKMKMYIWNICS